MYARTDLLIYAGLLSLVAVGVFVPQEAWACPACALREDGGLAGKFILAAMMMLPFGLAGFVFYVLRKTTLEEAKNMSSGPYEPEGGEQSA